MYLKINQINPQSRYIKNAAEVLKKGGVIIYPTDTFYGLGCDIMNKKAIERVYQIKQRDKKQPFSFICPDLKNISKYAKVSNFAYRNMKRLLPGPYTFVLAGSKMVPKIMLTKRRTAGIRVPDNIIATTIAKELGNPIISTSVTDPGGKAIEDSAFIYDMFNARVDLILDSGKVAGKASSVISLIDDIPEIIRYGAGNIDIFDK